MKKLLLLTWFLISLLTNAQSVQWSTNTPQYSNSDYENHRVATDSKGNVYTIGTYDGTKTDFDPGPGVFNMSSYSVNMYLLKLDASGNFVWAKQIGGSNVYSISYGHSITIDASDNIYFAGQVTAFGGGAFDFDMGAGVNNLSPKGGYNTFIEKLDSSGNFVWAKGFDRVPSPAPYDEIHSLKVGLNGNVYATGSFTGTTDFDPDAGVFNLATTNIDIFILKLNSSGGLVWAKALHNNTTPKPSFYRSGINVGYGIDTDSNGNVYTVGYFSDSIDADPGVGVKTLTSFKSDNPTQGGSNNLFISKLDSTGNYVWAYGLNGDHSLNVLPSLVIDPSNNVLITDYTEYPGVTDFDFGAGTFFLPSFAGAFVLKINSDAGFIWAKSTAQITACCNARSYSNSIAVDGLNNIYTAGTFSLGTYDFDPGAGTFLMTPNTQEIYVSKLDTNGNFIWAKQVGGSASSIFNGSLAISPTGKVVVSGTVQSGSFSRTTAAISTGGFLASITPPTTSLATADNEISKINLYPNPTDANLNLKLSNNFKKSTVKIYSVTGQIVLEKNNLVGNEFTFDVSNFAKGIYMLQVSDGKSTFNSKFIKK